MQPVEYATLPYPKFPKIPRLSRECIVTEKIDGTNGLVFVPESDDAPICAGSRNRWLESGKQDNFGFAGWVVAHAEELRELGPGLHHGEWWGVGIARGYDLYERRFSLFNVSRWTDDMVRPKCCHVVPIIQTLPRLDDRATHVGDDRPDQMRPAVAHESDGDDHFVASNSPFRNSHA